MSLSNKLNHPQTKIGATLRACDELLSHKDTEASITALEAPDRSLSERENKKRRKAAEDILSWIAACHGHLRREKKLDETLFQALLDKLEANARFCWLIETVAQIENIDKAYLEAFSIYIEEEDRYLRERR